MQAGSGVTQAAGADAEIELPSKHSFESGAVDGNRLSVRWQPVSKHFAGRTLAQWLEAEVNEELQRVH
jgi:hypothetical protein